MRLREVQSAQSAGFAAAVTIAISVGHRFARRSLLLRPFRIGLADLLRDTRPYFPDDTALKRL